MRCSKPPTRSANTIRPPSAIAARMLRMPDDRTQVSEGKVKRYLRVPLWARNGAFAFLLAGCGAGGLDLPAALARADARTYAACGRHAAPTDVRLVRGYIACGPQAQHAVGCTYMPARVVELSRVLHTQIALELVATHEYLHLLGANHVPAGHGIMGRDRGSQIDRVTAEDLAAARCPAPRPE